LFHLKDKLNYICLPVVGPASGSIPSILNLAVDVDVVPVVDEESVLLGVVDVSLEVDVSSEAVVLVVSVSSALTMTDIIMNARIAIKISLLGLFKFILMR
jgi:hypothetical protein